MVQDTAGSLCTMSPLDTHKLVVQQNDAEYVKDQSAHKIQMPWCPEGSSHVETDAGEGLVSNPQRLAASLPGRQRTVY